MTASGGRQARRAVVASAAAVVVVALVGVHTSTVAADGGSGLGAAPAAPAPSNPVTRSYIVASLLPGAVERNGIVVSNTGASTLAVRISSVDGLTAPTSGAVYGSGVQAPTRWGTWIVPDISFLTVQPHSQATVGVTIAVPANASPGDHLGGVAVQDTSASTDGSGVTVVSRVVVGVLVQVPGTAAFHLTVGKAWVGPVSAYDHTNLVFVPLTDDGLLLGKPDISVTLSGPNGYHATTTRQLDTLLPGDTITYPFMWPQYLPPGAYQIEVHPILTAIPPAPGAITVPVSKTQAPAGPIALVPNDQIKPGRVDSESSLGQADEASPLAPVIIAPAAAPPIAQILQSVAATSSFPLALLILVGLFLAVQNRIDRRDPKLALAPAFADEDLVFQPLPAYVGRTVTLPAGDPTDQER